MYTPIVAQLYDLLHLGAGKNYALEVGEVTKRLVREHPSARKLLDVGCGSGEHARLLHGRGYDVEALDLNPDLVACAGAKLGADKVHVGDMEHLALPKRYDAVLCLYSSIGYLETPERITRALERFRAHLAPGGVVMVEPWFEPGVLTSGRISVTSVEAEGVKITRMSVPLLEGRRSSLHFHYLIGRATGIEHASEVHTLGMLTVDEMTACFHAAGLDVVYDAVGISDRGLYIAKPTR